jgi:3',5'-cyclic AMP phosphodiesterase CpdA
MMAANVDPPPPPLRYATDRRILGQAEREVRRRLSPETRRRALELSSTADRLALRGGRPRRGSPDVFMPRDPYLSLVQDALERRMEYHRRQQGAAPEGDARGGPQAADGSNLALGDQLFERFGPDDFGWIQTAVEDALKTLDGGNHPFGTTPAEHPLGQVARIVLLADWGTGTPRAQVIAGLARDYLEAKPELERHLIHLGDVYYCGLPAEYRSRFLDDWPVSAGEGVTSWNLNGNHDMYSGGHGYFDVISRDLFAAQQGTSCFRLFNEHWQFIALDTAYQDNDLYDVQLPWLQRWVDEGSGRSVLLSHHQLGSALAQDSIGAGVRDKTAKVREGGRIHAWFWGHEHRCFVYEPYLGVSCPVCLGNGGVPELLSHRLTLEGAYGWVSGVISDLTGLFKRRVAAPRILYEPATPDVDADGLAWAKLGFVVLDLDGPRGSAVYIDEDGRETAITAFGAV